MVVPVVAAAGSRLATKRALLRTAASQVSKGGGGEGEVKYRVSWITAGLMLTLNAVFEAVQLLLNLTVFLAIASLYVSMLAYSIFCIWFLVLGVNFMQGSRAGAKMLALGGGIVFELIPILNALPASTISILSIVLLSRMEDREKSKRAEKSVPPPAANDDVKLRQAA